jgi:hypothetical protein
MIASDDDAGPVVEGRRAEALAERSEADPAVRALRAGAIT